MVALSSTRWGIQAPVDYADDMNPNAAITARDDGLFADRFRWVATATIGQSIGGTTIQTPTRTSR